MQSLAASTIPQINQELLVIPISKSLLTSCSVLYPLQQFNEQDSLNILYQNFLYNLGQVRKCYRKDEALIKEVINQEESFLEKTRNP